MKLRTLARYLSEMLFVGSWLALAAAIELSKHSSTLGASDVVGAFFNIFAVLSVAALPWSRLTRRWRLILGISQALIQTVYCLGFWAFTSGMFPD